MGEPKEPRRWLASAWACHGPGAKARSLGGWRGVHVMLLGAANFFDSRGAICAVEMHNVCSVFPGSAEFAPLWYNRLGRRDSLRVLLVCVSQGLYQSLGITVKK